MADEIERPLIEMRREKKAEKGADAAAADPAAPKMPNEMQQRANRVIVELSEAKLLRAIYSERQLEEVLTDFWFNHFNVDARKGPDRFMSPSTSATSSVPMCSAASAICSGATAESPAMLFYLDNWMSADPNGPHPEARPPQLVRGPFGRRMFDRGRAPGATAERERPPRPERELRPRADGAAHARRRRRLHAEGRHRSRARVHRLDDPESAQGGGFVFEPRLHDTGEKIVLGHRDQGRRRRERRRAGARHPRLASLHGALHLDRARAPLRQRHAAAGARRSRGGALPRDRRRSARGDAHDPDVAGVPVAGRRRRQGEDALRIRRQRRARDTRATSPTRSRWCGRCSSSACRSTSASRRPATRTRPRPGSTRARWSAG